MLITYTLKPKIGGEVVPALYFLQFKIVPNLIKDRCFHIFFLLGNHIIYLWEIPLHTLEIMTVKRQIIP